MPFDERLNFTCGITLKGSFKGAARDINSFIVIFSKSVLPFFGSDANKAYRKEKKFKNQVFLAISLVLLLLLSFLYVPYHSLASDHTEWGKICKKWRFSFNSALFKASQYKNQSIFGQQKYLYYTYLRFLVWIMFFFFFFRLITPIWDDKGWPNNKFWLATQDKTSSTFLKKGRDAFISKQYFSVTRTSSWDENTLNYFSKIQNWI